ncbi:hypothetical protein VTL71DRAFT_2099 [Oculimacula yallundae]|uniref:3-beta hydroxysteroid dehydrogenase/isomerase domain-containing protein n=1 Tax=Oculimacula yallundae TaxID=86028 RepID=A0ABR4C7Y5_9HELO
MASMQSSYLVLGGAGFLGSHLVTELLSRGYPPESIAVFDLDSVPEPEKIAGIRYFIGDITKEEQLLEVFSDTSPSIVFHTVAPLYGLPPPIYHQVNDEGTRMILSACIKFGVPALVYTSSTGVTWSGAVLNGVTEESAKIPDQGFDAYHHTKAVAERIVLAANDPKGLKTVALRCCGMIGERDRQVVSRITEVIRKGQQNIQIGDNANLVDWIYVGNAAYAHVLAAEKLLQQPDTIGGQAFYITNDEPIPFWDFNRLLMRELGDRDSRPVKKIPYRLALALAFLAELWCKLTGTTTQFMIYTVKFAALTQWYNIDKAKKLLGYKPKVSLVEGVKRTAQWWDLKGRKEHEARLQFNKDK